MIPIDGKFLLQYPSFSLRCTNELSHLQSAAEQKPDHAGARLSLDYVSHFCLFLEALNVTYEVALSTI